MSFSPFELHLTATPDCLELVRACAATAVRQAGITDPVAQKAIEATVEACANVVDHAYEGQSGPLILSGNLTGRHLIFSVQDRGVPFDWPESDLPDQSPSRVSRSGGLRFIRDSVDAAAWIPRGKEGKELRLSIVRPAASLSELHAEPDGDPVGEAGEVPQAPPQEYVIRRFRPEDAVGVSRCIYRVYGYTYLHEDCYYPDRLVRLNETGELISVVALDERGEVVGHYALERPGLGPVAERGMAVVAPAHRGRDLMGRMRELIDAEAVRIGLLGTFSHAVTRHTFSQRVNEEFGARVCGIALGSVPGAVRFHHIPGEAPPERVSGVIYFSPIAPSGPRRLHAPEHHREWIEQLYEGLGWDLAWDRPESNETPSGDGLEVTYSAGLVAGTIRAYAVGPDTVRQIRAARRRLVEEAGAELVALELPLEDPGTERVAQALEADGFFFSGIGPHFLKGRDALLLQHLAVPISVEAVRIHNPLARRMLEYVAAERSRVGEGP